MPLNLNFSRLLSFDCIVDLFCFFGLRELLKLCHEQSEFDKASRFHPLVAGKRFVRKMEIKHRNDRWCVCGAMPGRCVRNVPIPLPLAKAPNTILDIGRISIEMAIGLNATKVCSCFWSIKLYFFYIINKYSKDKIYNITNSNMASVRPYRFHSNASEVWAMAKQDKIFQACTQGRAYLGKGILEIFRLRSTIEDTTLYPKFLVGTKVLFWSQIDCTSIILSKKC